MIALRSYGITRQRAGKLGGITGAPGDESADVSRRRMARAQHQREDEMTATPEQVSDLLHEAGETHHQVFRIVDGADDDWASWYSDWLVNLSELPALLGAKPVRSELTYLLVSLDKEYTAGDPDVPWESYYARRILDHFRQA